MRRISFALICAFIIVLLTSCSQPMTSVESAAVACTKTVQESMYSKRSFELTDDIVYEAFVIVEDVEHADDINEKYLTIKDNKGYREYIAIEYAASNKMGVMYDDTAYFQVYIEEDGTYDYEYIGNRDYYYEIVDKEMRASLWRLDRMTDTPAESATISAKKIAKEVGCNVYEG